MHRRGYLRRSEAFRTRPVHGGGELEAFRHHVKRKPHACGERLGEDRFRQCARIRAPDGCENGFVLACANFIGGAQAIIEIENDGRSHQRILRVQRARNRFLLPWAIVCSGSRMSLFGQGGRRH